MFSPVFIPWAHSNLHTLDSVLLTSSLPTWAHLKLIVMCVDEREQESEMELIVMCIDDVDMNLPLFRIINPAQVMSFGGVEEQAETLSKSVSQWLANGTKDGLFQVRQVCIVVIVRALL